MLTLELAGAELFDEKESEILILPSTMLELEHSLLSLSKWEQKFQKPFLSGEEKTDEQIMYYIECMSPEAKIPRGDFLRITSKHIAQINEYIENPMTATWFSNTENKPSREILTNELIYYWMFTAGIPKECERWHINQLFTLLRVYAAKSEKPKHMPEATAAAQRRDLNERRKAELGTTG